MPEIVASVYARLSQDKRAGTDLEGTSVEAQVKACKAFIARKGWTLGEIYTDNSISATSGATRPAFERLLTDAPSLVVYMWADRISRSTRDTERFLEAGIEGLGVDGSRISSLDTNSKLFTRIQTILAVHEGELKADRIRLANKRIAESGTYRGSIRPFGQERDGTWVKEEAEAIREAVEKLLDGSWSFYRVSVVWNERGLLTPQTGKQGGRAWTSTSVKLFFSRPRLYGFQEYKGTLHELKDWKPLLSRDEWDAIQELGAHKKGTRPREISTYRRHLLSGIAVCWVCGRGMNSAYRGGKKGTGLVYRCPTTSHPKYSADPVEKWIIARTVPLLVKRQALKEKELKQNTELAKLLKKRGELERKHDEWVSEALSEGLKPSLIAVKEKSHAEVLEALERQIADLRAQAIGKILLPFDTWTPSGAGMIVQEDYGFTEFRELSIETQREVVRSIWKKITVKPAGQGKRFSWSLMEDCELSELGLELLGAERPTD